RGPRLRQRRDAAGADVVPRLRARLDEAAVLELQVRLQHRRDADALLPAEPPHRRDAVAGPQRAARDQIRDVRGDTVVEVNIVPLLDGRLHEPGLYSRAKPALPAQLVGVRTSTVAYSRNCTGLKSYETD